MADRPPEGTRARGKARGRARPSESQQKAPQPQLGVAPTAAAPQQPPVASAAAAYPAAVAGGRKSHRGVPRSDVETLSSQMRALEMSGDAKGRGATRRGVEDYSNDNTRPAHISDKTGTTGAKCTIVSNYFELLSKPQWIVHHYHVDFAPIVESPRVRRGLMACQKEILGSCYLFDGMSDLKSITKLPQKETELFAQRNTDGETIRITIKHVAELASNHPELGRLYNTQMRRNLQHLNYTLLGRYYFDNQSISDVPEYKLKIWEGVITSIRQHETNLMMLVDSVHKVVREDTALEVIRDLVSRNQAGYRDAVVKELVGAIVMTKYNNKTYRIEEVMWDLDPRGTFETKEGPISYIDYYKKQYDIKVRDLQQPLLLCTSKEREVRQGQREMKKIYLLPEICCMTGLTDKMRSNFTMMKELGRHTKLDPARRVQNLMRFIDKVNSNPEIQTEMNRWQLRFAQQLVTLTGRTLAPEAIIQGKFRSEQQDPKKGFIQEMRGKPMHTSRNMDDWIVICTKRDQRCAQDFISTLVRVGPPMGMMIAEPNLICIDQDRVNNYIQVFRENRTRDTCLVCFIVPSDKKDRYDALKKATCIDYPIPSQVIITKTLTKKQMLMSVATKIGIQLNCKLGGEPWALEIPLKMAIMVVGFDTYHDSSRKGRSAGGFVASLNSTFTRWYSRASFHQAGGWEELSNHLRVHLTEALKVFQSVNKRLPSMILFYRDGVGDGQIRYVVEHELAQFVQTINDVMEPGAKREEMQTRYAFIVVNKRINTRFFAKVGQRYQNPEPGTIVDSVVTRPDRYDFFLVSQSAREGTVAPTMFNVIADKSGLKPDHVQRLSYKLTHLYYNWPGTIRVPAPCQYAHKLAFLCGQSLHMEPAECLQQNLFYL